MKFFTIATLLAAVAVAHPLEDAGLELRAGGDNNNTPTDRPHLCPQGLYSNAQCCDVFLLGIIGLDCKTPSGKVYDANDFRKECTKTGDKPLCCVAPVADQAILCQPALGV
ncbi:hypothetical protein TrVFT333_001898 [Trichoderma virens FT-333]|nr:hypothetical protein TrVFT333_001898 [Trichoderma virens FT-333]